MERRHGSTLEESDAGFVRMFPQVPGTPYKVSVLAHLAAFLTRQTPPNRDSGSIPAGYTYFGQFVDHDMTLMDAPPALPGNRPVQLSDLLQQRTSALDLDSVYGLGLDDPVARYTDDGRFYSHALDNGSIYDLPRPVSNSPFRPLIPDPRNDENFIVAQIHVLFMNLHNRVMARLELLPGTQTLRMPQRFALARRIVTLAYQQVIRWDYLKRILSAGIWQHLFSSTDRPQTLMERTRCEEACIPIEFSAAAFRFGHTMVLFSYRLNGTRKNELLHDLFRMTGAGMARDVMNGKKPERIDAKSNVDWRHFFPVEQKGFQFAARIEPILTSDMTRLPMEPGGNNNMYMRNLLRGRQVQLPCAQDIIRYLQSSHGPGIPAYRNASYRLVRDYYDDRPVSASREDFSLDAELNGLMDKTPLWLYVLIEARLERNGNGLGTLGSIIVGETFRMLLECSTVSILRPNEVSARHRDDVLAPQRTLLFEIAGTDVLPENEMLPIITFADLVRFVNA